LLLIFLASGKEGKPWVMDYEGKLHALHESDYEYETDSDDDSDTPGYRMDNSRTISQEDIEANFQAKKHSSNPHPLKSMLKRDQNDSKDPITDDPMLESFSDLNIIPDLAPQNSREQRKEKNKKTLKTLDDLLNDPIPKQEDRNITTVDTKKKRRTHRRTQSEPFLMEDAEQRMEIMWSAPPTAIRRPILRRVDSYGRIDEGQPSLMDQVRRRAASVTKVEDQS
jgi:hypothetical protein